LGRQESLVIQQYYSLDQQIESHEAGPLITVAYLSFISIYFTTCQYDANYKPCGGEGREQHNRQQGQRR